MPHRPRPSATRRAARGFTLIEVIVMVVIIAILASVVGLRLLPRITQAKQSRAASDAASLVSAVKLFMVDHGLPPDGSGIMVLWDGPSGAEGFKPEIDSKDQLIDPWNREYVLLIPGPDGREFAVVSYGADGSPGGEGEDADIIKP